MKSLALALLLIPGAAFAGPWYELVNGTMSVTGIIGVSASSATPKNYVLILDGAHGFIQFPDATKQTTAASAIPTGAVMSFYLSACPSGWIIADGTNNTPNMKGMFVRGLDTTGTIDAEKRVLGSSETFMSQGHNTTIVDPTHRHAAEAGSFTNTLPGTVTGNPLGTAAYSRPNTAYAATGITATTPITDGVNGIPIMGKETRPKNIALLFCMKQ